jgi:dTDP-4-dehydrorhamnose reductase
MKQILLIGKNGQVGWELQRTLATLGHVTALDFPEIDLANADALRATLRSHKANIIVNAAAYTAVDLAEKETERAHAINATAPGIMAEEARKYGALLVHYSTEYVFDGSGTAPFCETTPTGPLNCYGHSKLAGDQAIQAVDGRHLILRTSWVYGLRGKNFLLTMLRLAQEREELRVVADQIGAPTWSRMIAEATAQILSGKNDTQGLFHLTSSGATSWCGFTEAILEMTQNQRTRHPRLTGIPTVEYPLPAARPLNSRLSCEMLQRETGIALPHWREALGLCLAQ